MKNRRYHNNSSLKVFICKVDPTIIHTDDNAKCKWCYKVNAFVKDFHLKSYEVVYTSKELKCHCPNTYQAVCVCVHVQVWSFI